MVPSPLVFQMISTHFTAPPFVPHVPTFLNLISFPTEIQVEPGDLNRNLTRRLQNSLRPVIPDNACTPRLTAAAGTWLAGAYSRGTVSVSPTQKKFTTRRPSSFTRRRSVRLSPIAEDSQLLPPVGVWPVSQCHCG